MGIVARAISKDEYVPTVRHIDGLTILFYKKDEIWVKGTSGNIIFHRWFSNTRGFYKSHWEPFQKALKHKNGLVLTDVLILARKYEIDYMVSHRWPEGDKYV